MLINVWKIEVQDHVFIVKRPIFGKKHAFYAKKRSGWVFSGRRIRISPDRIVVFTDDLYFLYTIRWSSVSGAISGLEFYFLVLDAIFRCCFQFFKKKLNQWHDSCCGNIFVYTLFPLLLSVHFVLFSPKILEYYFVFKLQDVASRAFTVSFFFLGGLLRLDLWRQDETLYKIVLKKPSGCYCTRDSKQF